LITMESQFKRNAKTKSPDSRDIDLGRRVRAQRLVRGMSQTDLANRIGITFQQVQKYEKGVNRVGAGRLTRIAEALGVPVAFLFGATEAPAGSPGEGANAAFAFLETERGGAPRARLRGHQESADPAGPGDARGANRRQDSGTISPLVLANIRPSRCSAQRSVDRSRAAATARQSGDSWTVRAFLAGSVEGERPVGDQPRTKIKSTLARASTM
jgi:transcriptional regulator with XRE-family HTH domain